MPPTKTGEVIEILESITDAFMTIDPEWQFTYVNHAAARLLQRTCAELLGRNVWEIFPEARQAGFFKAYHRAVNENIPVFLEEYYPPLSIWFEIRAFPTPQGLTVYFRDITERKQLDQSLHLRNSALQASNNGILIVDALAPHMPLVFVNPAFETITGYCLTESLGHNCRFLQKDDRDQPELEIIRHALRVGGSSNTILRNYRKDGTLFYNELHLSPIRDTQGNVTHYIGIMQDVTERRRTEIALKDSEKRYRLLASNLQGTFLLLNRDLRCILADGLGLNDLGLNREKIVGKCPADVFPPETARVMEAQYQKVLAGETLSFEVELLGIQHRIQTGPVRDETGEITGVYVVRQNITHEKQLEKERTDALNALKTSEERFRTLTEQISDVITILSPTGIIQYASAALLPRTGYAPEEIVGKNLGEFLHPDEREELFSRIEQALSGRIVRGVPYRFHHKDGSWRWVETIASNQIGNPAIGGLIATSRDVTEQVRLQAQMVQSEKLASLGELVAGVAHEINNPLAAIGGYAQLLTMQPYEPVHADARSIQEMVNRINRIIHALRNFTHPHSKVREANSLNNIINTALEVIGFTLRNAGIEIIQTLQPDLPPVLLHVGEIEQVLVNLLANAQHALRDNPADNRRIHLTTALREEYNPDAETTRQWCLLILQDNGTGIPENVLPHIFDPFFTTKDIGEGTGLGLYISHGILAAHGGKIDVQSKPGEGTTFTLYFPAATHPPDTT